MDQILLAVVRKQRKIPVSFLPPRGDLVYGKGPSGDTISLGFFSLSVLIAHLVLPFFFFSVMPCYLTK